MERLNIGKLNIRDAKPIRRLPDELVKKYNLTFNLTYSYDCDDNIKVESDLIKNGKLITDFGVVKGNFDCSGNKLISLKGCPVEVGGNFYCDNNELTSLEGCPVKVGGNFYCNNNELTSLEGCPTDIGGDFCCIGNHLISLEDGPDKVGGHFVLIS